MGKSGSEAPAFQFYAQDFLNGTGTMSNAEVGAYIRMLAWSWNNGPLPLEEPVLARVAVTSVAELRRLWPVVGAKWKRDGRGWVNERLEGVRAEREAYLKKQAEAGIASAAKRNQKANQTATTVQPEHQPTSQPEGQPLTQPNGNSSVFGLRSSELEPPPTDRAVALAARARRGGSVFDDLWHVRNCPVFTLGACNAGVCVPRKLHEEWMRQLTGGRDLADTLGPQKEIGLMVDAAVARLQPGGVSETPYDFWRAVWRATRPSQAPPKPSAYETTTGSVVRAGRQYLDGAE